MKVLDYFDAYAERYQLYKAGAWCYEDGLIYRGLGLLHQATGERRFLDHLLRLSDRQISETGDLTGYSMDEFNIDHILAGRCLFYLDQVTGHSKYMKAAAHLAQQLARHPRTDEGNYWHKEIYPEQVWLDGLYMGLPFQVEYGLKTGASELVADALKQLSRALELTATEDGLYVHGYDHARTQDWADKASGKSMACWARAIGWLAMALVDVAELIGEEAWRVSELSTLTKALLQRVVELQQPDGRWLQVIDQPDLAGNYPESSASAMFAYALLKSVRLGVLPEGEAAGLSAVNSLYEKALVADEDGVTRFAAICHVAGLGGFSGVYRDGSPEYYLTEAIVSDDSKGVGPLMMAEAERLWLERAALSSNQKQALP